MNQTESQFTNDVMRRVRMIHFARRIKNHPLFMGALFVISSTIITFSISLQQIFANMSGLSTTDRIVYLGSSYTKTTLGVQAFLLVAGISCLWFLKQIIMNFRGFGRNRRMLVQ